MFVDTHCHLNFDNFDSDRVEVLKRASAAGIIRILNPGINLDTSQSALEIAESSAQVYAAVGVHPNEARSWHEDTYQKISALAKRSKVVAIGEIGLDYYWDRSSKSLQRQVFEDQLSLAAECELPVIIHFRDRDEDHRPALTDLLSILALWKESLRVRKSAIFDRPGVLHSFSGDLQAAKRAVEMGYFLGITGPVTFKKAEMLRNVVTSLPAEMLLTETDSPFLTPHPHRGERNEPAYVKYITEEISRLRQDQIGKISQITSRNAERLFNW